MTLVSKYNVIGYIGTYYALASTPITVTIHYFAYHYCNYWRMVILNAESILYGCIAVFTVLTPTAIIILKMKLGLRLNIIKEILYSIVFGIFFSGIGWSMMLAIAAHLFGVNMSWGSTNKDGWSVKAYMYELRRMWPMYIICFGQLTMIGLGWFLLDLRAWPAIVPMALSASAHMIVPLFSLL